MKPIDKKFVPPDGGWGWMVCLGFGLIIFSLRSLDASFGLLFSDLLKDLKIETTGVTFITSLSDSIINFSGLFNTPLIKKFGFRMTGVLGSLLSTTGLIFTSRATSFTYLIFSHGILTGLGTGLAVGAGMVAVNTYFTKKRTQGMGFAMAGSSIGMMFMPQIIYFLLTYYDFRGAVLIIGSITLHALLGSCLLQPVSWHLVPANESCEKELELIEVEGNALLKRKFNSEEKKLMKIKKPITNIAAESNEGSKDREKSEELRKAKKSWIEKLVKIFDLEMLKNPTFLNLLLGLSLFYVAEVNFKILSPFFLTSIGMAKHEVAFALTLTAFADVVSRLTVPTIVMRLNLRNRQVFWATSLLVGISRSVMAEQKPGKILTANLILNGFLRGITTTNLNVCIAENCEIDKLPAAIGMLMVSKGLFVAGLGPLIGFIRDYSGSYQVCIHSMTSLIALCSVTWGIEFLYVNIIRVHKVRNMKSERINETI